MAATLICRDFAVIDLCAAQLKRQPRSAATAGLGRCWGFEAVARRDREAITNPHF